MLLTRIWGVILAALASLCLGGMFLLSQGNSGDFSDADRTALRAVTEAGLAALEAQIDSSPVRQVGAMLLDPAVREALGRTAEQEAKLPIEKKPMQQIFTDAAEDLRVRNKSDMTVAFIDPTGAPVAVSGIGEPLVSELVGSTPYQDAPTDEDLVFSLTLGGQIQAVRLLRADANGRRLVAFEPLQIGAGSLLRRVLGSESPAGLVRKGKLVGDIIGDQPVSAEIEKLGNEHREDAPDEGASKIITIGEGLDARIGALGRVPGPAGKGKEGAMLVVLSRRTAAAGHRDLTDALGQARDKGLVSTANWVLLVLLLGLCAALAVYLPQVEALGPMRRLANEFVAVSRGAQHQIFHDRYGGPTGEVARAANAAHEALRAAYLAELEIDEEVAEDTGSTRQRPKTIRGRKLTRSVRKVEDADAPSTAPDPVPVPAPAPAPAPIARAPEPPPATATVMTPAAPRVPLPKAPARPAAPAPAPAPVAPSAPVVAPAPSVAPPRRATPAAVPPPTPEPVAAEDTGGDDSEDRIRYFREIFDEFLQVKIACGENTDGFTFDKFAKKLQKNTQDILEKHTDVRDVQFIVYVKDGKAALKAKVIRGTGG
jgi:hypothetical protein